MIEGQSFRFNTNKQDTRSIDSEPQQLRQARHDILSDRIILLLGDPLLKSMLIY